MFDQLSAAMHFSKIDPRSGFHQNQTEPELIPVTPFNTRYTRLSFGVLPFGLIIDPAVFIDLMNMTFWNKLDMYVSAYLDEIRDYSKTFAEHLRQLKWY